jgi:hypothetical protein
MHTMSTAKAKKFEAQFEKYTKRHERTPLGLGFLTGCLDIITQEVDIFVSIFSRL